MQEIVFKIFAKSFDRFSTVINIEDSCQINMALCKADIFVSSIWVEQAGLEEFFFNMTGGGKNA